MSAVNGDWATKISAGSEGARATVTQLGPGGELASCDGVVVQSPTMQGIVLLRAFAGGDRAPQPTTLEAGSCATAWRRQKRRMQL